jgi:hypothetical protein
VCTLLPSLPGGYCFLHAIGTSMCVNHHFSVHLMQHLEIFLPLVLKQNCQYALLVFISGSYKIDPSKSRKLFGISKKSQIPLINMEPMARIQTMHT